MNVLSFVVLLPFKKKPGLEGKLEKKPFPPTSFPLIFYFPSCASRHFWVGRCRLRMAENEVNNDGVQFFEGVEKLLEVWFTRADDTNIKNCDLRKIPR